MVEGSVCMRVDVPEELCVVDDELKAIYHGRDTVCVWVFRTRADRGRFMDDTEGAFAKRTRRWG